jgi:predicted Ser/Thr protein kinase
MRIMTKHKVIRKKNEKKRREGERKNNRKEKGKIEKEIEKTREGITGISPSYSCDTVWRSCFAKCFSKTDLASPGNLLHQHSHSHSCHSHSHSRANTPQTT